MSKFVERFLKKNKKAMYKLKKILYNLLINRNNIYYK